MVRTAISICILWVGTQYTLSFSRSTQPAQLPNIVVIYADDMGYGDVSSYNAESKIQTPEMDKLVEDGMKFTDAHSTSGVCTPSRYSLLTGRYSWRTRLKSGVLSGFTPALIEEGRLTIASMLKTKGYRTAVVGKWHLGLDWTPDDKSKPPVSTTNLTVTQAQVNVDFTDSVGGNPTEFGFDYSYILPASLDITPYLYVEGDSVIEPNVYWATGKPGRNGYTSNGFEWIECLDHFTDKTQEWIVDHVNNHSNTPFFMYMPLPSPHTPVLPTAPFQGKSQAGAYGDFVIQTDWTIGEVVKTIDTMGIRNNTLIIVTSDNGPETQMKARKTQYNHYSSGVLRGMKRDAWEGGHRVPFIASWPGTIKSGTIADEVLCQSDLIATFAALVNFKLPTDAGEDSYSMLPVLLDWNYSSPIREGTVHHTSSGGFAIRQGDMKFIDGAGSMGSSPDIPYNGPDSQIYNLANDIEEMNNLYNGSNPQIVTPLKNLLEKYKADGRSTPLNRTDSLIVPITKKELAADFVLTQRGDYLLFPNKLGAAISFQIQNLKGQVVFNINLDADQKFWKIPRELIGVYLLKIRQGDRSVHKAIALGT